MRARSCPRVCACNPSCIIAWVLVAGPQAGASPIFIAALNGQVEAVKLLIEAKADIDSMDNVRSYHPRVCVCVCVCVCARARLLSLSYR